MKGWLYKIWTGALIFCAFILLPAYQNCGGSAPQANTAATITLTSAQVQKSTVDGCQFLLVSTNKATGVTQSYVPLKMDPQLLQDGMNVTVTGVIATDLVSTCMAGPLLQVTQAQSL
jgi:hypothetical protein